MSIHKSKLWLRVERTRGQPGLSPFTSNGVTLERWVMVPKMRQGEAIDIEGLDDAGKPYEMDALMVHEDGDAVTAKVSHEGLFQHMEYFVGYAITDQDYPDQTFEEAIELLVGEGWTVRK